MKKIVSIVCTFLCVCTLMACTSDKGETKQTKKQERTNEKTNTSDTKTLIVYFSQTGTTRKIAYEIADIMHADMYELIPTIPYSQEDVDYTDSSSRATQEQSDDRARPSIEHNIDNMSEYTNIILAYPIWFGEAPKIMYTFLESYDLSNKTIVPICTSGSSDIGASVISLQNITSSSTLWKDGMRFDKDTDTSMLKNWIQDLQIE